MVNEVRLGNLEKIRMQHPNLSESAWIVKFLMVVSLVIGASSRTEEYVRSHYLYQGRLYAGHGQFPWVVEIRNQLSEDWSLQEQWSVGNLIGPKYVMSTCSAVATFEILDGVADRFVVVPKPFYQYKVMYSPDYPYHGPKWYINRYLSWKGHLTELKTGTRSILKMLPHPYCNPTSFEYFFGIAQLGSDPIRPFRLFVNYAPAILDRKELENQWYFFKTKPYIAGKAAAWGRDLSDPYSHDSMLFNFKLKYYVKIIEPSECQKIVKKLGWGEWNDKLEFDKNTFCMSLWDPDNTMGTICDHDRGAPIVYNDFVIGLVMTGAVFSECSNLNPLPFVAQSIAEAQLYWANVERHILSYYITNNTHLFPGLTGFAQSDSPPLHSTTFTILLLPGLLLIGEVLRRQWFYS